MDNLLSGANINYVIILFALGMVPLLFMGCTSYLKISIVLSILRNALGGGQIPSQAVSGLISLFLTIFTISPVLTESFQELGRVDKVKSSSSVLKRIEPAFTPLRKFLRNNTALSERFYFYKLQEVKVKKNELSLCEDTNSSALSSCLDEKESVSSLVVSFLSSELRIGCTIGIYIFLPFLAIDILVSTLLTALGMMMVSPVTISLPIKLLLFVVSDGWKLLMENLILSYNFN